jgi:hypothetical protein
MLLEEQTVPSPTPFLHGPVNSAAAELLDTTVDLGDAWSKVAQTPASTKVAQTPASTKVAQTPASTPAFNNGTHAAANTSTAPHEGTSDIIYMFGSPAPADLAGTSATNPEACPTLGSTSPAQALFTSPERSDPVNFRRERQRESSVGLYDQPPDIMQPLVRIGIAPGHCATALDEAGANGVAEAVLWLMEHVPPPSILERPTELDGDEDGVVPPPTSPTRDSRSPAASEGGGEQLSADMVRCAFFREHVLHPKMPLEPTPLLRLKRACV